MTARPVPFSTRLTPQRLFLSDLIYAPLGILPMFRPPLGQHCDTNQ